MRSHGLLIFFLLIAEVAMGADSTLVVGIPNAITHLHPFEVTTAQQSFILPLIYETLLVTEVNGDTQPNLIREWKINEKEKSLNFRIREDVRFSDGSKLTASDVVESFRMACQHPLKAQELNIVQGCLPYKEKSFGVSIVGDLIKVTVDTHPSYLLTKLAGENIFILKKKGDAFIGTGPLRFKELTDKKLSLEKNRLHRFWDKGSKFGLIEFLFTPESQISQEIKKGKVHVASMYLMSTAQGIHSKYYHIVGHAPNVVQALALNRNVTPFQDSELRKSLHQMLRESNFETCHSGARKTFGFIPKGIGGSLEPEETEIKTRPLTKLRLQKRTKVIFPRHEGRKNKCEEDRLREVFDRHNIDVEITYYKDYDALDKAVLDPRVQGFLELYVYKTRDASSHLKKMVPENKQNFYLFSSSQIKQLLRKAWEAKDLRARFSTYKEINRIIYNSSSLIDLYAIGHANLIHKCLLKVPDNVAYYNPNSFLFLLKLDFNSRCSLGANR